MTGDLLADFTLPEPMEVKSITWLSKKLRRSMRRFRAGTLSSVSARRPLGLKFPTVTGWKPLGFYVTS